MTTTRNALTRKNWKPRKPATEAQKAARQQKLQKLTDWTKQAPTDEAPDPLFNQWQSCRRKLEQFSLKNQWLIYLQRPTATEVHSFQNWKKYGRSVKKGEAGLMIWVPIGISKKTEEELAEGDTSDEKPTGFVVGYVFDVEQTEPTRPKGWKDIETYQAGAALPGTTGPAKFVTEIVDIEPEPAAAEHPQLGSSKPALITDETEAGEIIDITPEATQEGPQDAQQDETGTEPGPEPERESYADWMKHHVIFLDPFKTTPAKSEPAKPQLSGLGTVPGRSTPNAEPDRTQLHQIPTSKGYTLSLFDADGERIDLAEAEHTELEGVPF